MIATAEHMTSIDGVLRIELRYVLEPSKELFTIPSGIDSAGYYFITMNSESPPAHRWHNDERLTLCLLQALYNNPPNELFKVFNFIFEARLNDEGKPYGLGHEALRSMLYHLQVVKNEDEPWKTVQGLPIIEIRRKFSDERCIIEEAAISAQVELRLKINNDEQNKRLKDTFQRRFARSEQNFRDDTPESSIPDLGTDTDTDESPLQARAQRSRLGHQSSFFPPRPLPPTRKPILLTKRTDLQRQHPVLLFRAFDPRHKFKSRQFLKNGFISQPPLYNSRKFKEAVVPHLEINTKYQSPFVSFGDNPLSVLNRIKSKHSLSFSIFEFEALNDDLRKRFGKEHGLHLVNDICRNVHSLDNLPGGYTGVGEWLAWGSVNVKPIAILSTSEALALLGIIETTRSVDYETGQRIGQRLSTVPPAWREAVAYKLSRAFKTKGYTHRPRGKAYHDFIDGVYSVAGNGSCLSSVMPDIAESPKDQSECIDSKNDHCHDHTWADWRSDTSLDEDTTPVTTALRSTTPTTHFGDISAENVRNFRKQIENFRAQAEVLLSRLPPTEGKQAPVVIDLTLNSESETEDANEDKDYVIV